MLFKRLMIVGLALVLSNQVHAVAANSNAKSVWISRPDGAQSCAPESGVSLDKGASELKKADIPVWSKKKGNDGMMHAQMCGADTGTTNAFLIPRDKLTNAEALGYRELASVKQPPAEESAPATPKATTVKAKKHVKSHVHKDKAHDQE